MSVTAEEMSSRKKQNTKQQNNTPGKGYGKVMARTLNAIRERFTKLSNNRHIKFGFPMLIFVVGGSFVLEQFAKVRYEFRKVNPYRLPEQGDELISTVKPEEEYEKLKQINLKNWENKRISRPWESEENLKSGGKSNL